MKKVLNLSLMIILLSTGNLVKAAGDLDVKVLDNQNLLVTMEEGDKTDILFFKDKSGIVLFKDSVGLIRTYQKTLNLELVPDGIYFLNLEKENSVHTTVVSKTSRGLEVNSSSDVVFKPCFKTTGKRVSLFLNNPIEKKVQVNVYDAVGVLVGKIESKEVVVTKAFDFSRVPAGKYRFIISIDNQNFTKELAIR